MFTVTIRPGQTVVCRDRNTAEAVVLRWAMQGITLTVKAAI